MSNESKPRELKPEEAYEEFEACGKTRRKENAMNNKSNAIPVIEYDDGAKILTILMGDGDINVCSVVQKDDGMAGVAFIKVDKGAIGREIKEHVGKNISELNPMMQILSTKTESLIALRGIIDVAINNLREIENE